jgi:signal transduction histidine kinase
MVGVSVDITDRKKVENMTNRFKQQQELYKAATAAAHDIASPVSSLKTMQYISKQENLSQKESEILTLAIKNIEDISSDLMSKYKTLTNTELGIGSETTNDQEDNYISPYLNLQEVIETFKRENNNLKIKLKSELDRNSKFVFIKGDSTDFNRMMSNLINNASEAIEGKAGIIDVVYGVKGIGIIMCNFILTYSSR